MIYGRTLWDDNWSSNWPGHPTLGGLRGFTTACNISRHDVTEPRGVYRVALSCGPEVIRMVGAHSSEGYAVMDDYGNLVSVEVKQ